MPKVSVVIPVYNSEKYIEETINSFINQTFQDFEIVLVDDFSTDKSVDIIRNIDDDRIKLYFNGENRGIAYTRNKAVELSVGEYIAFMDHDDIATPYRLEHEVEYLNMHQEIDLVGGNLRMIDEAGKDLNKQCNVFLNPNYTKAYLLLENRIASGSIMIRKEFIVKNNLKFLDHQYGAEDYRFWVECSLIGKIGNIDEVLLLWRTGHNSETARVKTKKIGKRKEVLNSIRQYALIKSGFRLDKNETVILNKVFDEEGTVDNEEELKELYKALKKIATQAKELNLENKNEIVTMCRKRFGEKVGKAFYLWK